MAVMPAKAHSPETVLPGCRLDGGNGIIRGFQKIMQQVADTPFEFFANRFNV